MIGIAGRPLPGGSFSSDIDTEARNGMSLDENRASRELRLQTPGWFGYREAIVKRGSAQVVAVRNQGPYLTVH